MPGFGKSGIARMCSLRSIAPSLGRPPNASRCGIPGFRVVGKGRTAALSSLNRTLPTSMAPSATILASEESDGFTLRAEGTWLVTGAAELDRRLHDLDLPTGQHVTLDLAGVERLDTTGAWLLLRTERA